MPATSPAATPAAVKRVAKTSPQKYGNGRDEPDITSPGSSAPHNGYSIQIVAAMDEAGANQMLTRLHQLGYQAYKVETLIGGQTWYRVRVGPYATQDQAEAAETKLHQQYSGAVTAH